MLNYRFYTRSRIVVGGEEELMLYRKRLSRISLVTSFTILFSLLTLQYSNADDLSDAQASLVAAQASLATAQSNLASARTSLQSKTNTLNATDSSTVTTEIYTSLQNEATVAATAVTNAEAQEKVLSLSVASWTKKIEELKNAIVIANNCPSTWGLVENTFSEGIDIGTYILNNKTLSELGKDSKNIVVNTQIDFSKDGSTWTQLYRIDSNQWLNFSNYYKYNQSPQTIRFLSNNTDLLRYSGAKIRAITTIAKQNCTSITLSPAIKSLTIAEIQFSKTSISDLYSAYPNAFPNYQVRDYFISLIETIKKDFITKAGSGEYYYLNNGYRDGSQLAIYPRNADCTGDVNRVLVQSNRTCEIGIYWFWRDVMKLVDVAVATGGLSAAQKQIAAMKLELPSLIAIAQKNAERMYALTVVISNLESKYSNADINNAQAGIQEFTNVNSAFSSLASEIQVNRSKLTVYAKSSFGDSEVRAMIDSVYSHDAKAFSYYENIEVAIERNISKLNQLTAVSATEVKQEQSNSQNLLQNAQLEYNSSASYQNKYLNLNFSSLDSKFVSEQLNMISSAQSRINLQLNIVSQKLKNSEAQMNSNLSLSLLQIWKLIYSNYNKALTLLNQSQSTLNILLNKFKSVTSFTDDTSEAKTERAKAEKLYSDAKYTFSNVSAELKNMISNFKSKGIVTAKELDYEAQLRKSMADKISIVVAENLSFADSFQVRLDKASTSDEKQSWLFTINMLRETAALNKQLAGSYLKMVTLISDYKISLGISSSGSDIAELDGENEEISGSVKSKKEATGRYLITINTNQSNYDVTVKAIKARAKAIVFNISTDDNGDISFRTTRKLAGYTLQLWADGTMISTTKKLT